MRSKLNPLRFNDLLYRAQVGRADHSTRGRARDLTTAFERAFHLVARDVGHLDDTPNMIRLMFSKSSAV
jgi:hypothetical protein